LGCWFLNIAYSAAQLQGEEGNLGKRGKAGERRKEEGKG